jgi:hypothetical protein
MEFKNTWNVWYHHTKDNWKLSGYRQIYNITNIKNFWELYNNWNKLGGILSKQFFVMKNNITPLWEDKMNINGGCWSLKININLADKLWEYLSILLVGEKIYDNDNINGLSICVKKNNICVIKIWIKDNNNNIKLLNKDIFEKYQPEILFIINNK